MSQKTRSLKIPDADLLGFVDNICTQVSAHETDWRVNTQQFMEVNTLLANAKKAYAENRKVDSKNHATAVAKKYAFNALKVETSLFIDALEGNAAVPDEALELMNLRPRHPHAAFPLPVPTETPVVDAVRQHDELTVYASKPEHDQPTATVGPKRYHGFAIRYKFEGDAEYKIVYSTRLHYTFIFDQEDDGRRLLFSAAWINPRLEHGPWSMEIAEIIG
jgi:hypothetical protein